MREETDEALHRRLVAGDLTAFDLLYARHARPLFAFLRRELDGDGRDAEDVLHEAFLGLLKEKSPPARSFKAWLYQVARHLCLNRARTRRRGEGALVREAAGSPRTVTPPEGALAQAQVAALVKQAVERLPRELAQVYQLRASGLSLDEVAHVLGVPLGTVKSRLHTVVGRLREEVGT